MGFIPRPPEGAVSPAVLIHLEWWIGTGRDALLRFVRDVGHHLLPDAVRVLTPAALERDCGEGEHGEDEMFLVVRLAADTDLHATFATQRERRSGYKCPSGILIPDEIAEADLSTLLAWEQAVWDADDADDDL